MRKPMKTPDELIKHLEDKGVQFNIIKRPKAKKHLSGSNYYFKLTSYRKNYPKYTTGKRKDQYENLEFAYLVELARLDVEIRHLLLQMSLDIEHFLRVFIMKEAEALLCQNKGEDGYEVIRGFLLADDIESISKRAEVSSKRSNSFTRKMSQNRRNPYTGGLIENYSDEMPIWTFVELSSFGDLMDFLDYYSKKRGIDPPVDLMSIDRVRQLRNACAHGNCIINDLYPVKPEKSGKKDKSSAPLFITNFVQKAGVSKTMREKKLSNPRINQIVHLLYVYDKVISRDKNTRKQRIKVLTNLIDRRCKKNAAYFEKNQILTSTYDFFAKIAHYMA